MRPAIRRHASRHGAAPAVLVERAEGREDRAAGAVVPRNTRTDLAAAEQGKKSLEVSSKQADRAIQEARVRAAEIIAQAEKRDAQMVEAAKVAAKAEGDREKAAAKADIQQEAQRAREQLREQVAALAVAGAEKILRREVDAKAHAELLDGIKKQL